MKRILIGLGLCALVALGAMPDLSKLESALAADPDNIRYGSEYRQAVIQAKEYDRSLKFFEKLVADHPKSGNAYLNYGFAYVDKIPAAGSITLPRPMWQVALMAYAGLFLGSMIFGLIYSALCAFVLAKQQRAS